MKIKIIMAQPPGPTSEFIEIEDEHGHGLKVGTWEEHGEYWALVIDTQEFEDLDEWLEQLKVANMVQTSR
jgi:type II secretory pathway component PulM